MTVNNYHDNKYANKIQQATGWSTKELELSFWQVHEILQCRKVATSNFY
jgi:hypothetical protein